MKGKVYQSRGDFLAITCAIGERGMLAIKNRKLINYCIKLVINPIEDRVNLIE